MRKNSGFLTAIYTMGIAVLFLAGFFLLVVFGAQTYRSVAGGQDKNNQSRALLSYLSTCVRAGDGRIEIREGETEDSSQRLVVADGDSGYGVWIYAKDGKLVEAYGTLEEEPASTAAQEIGKTDIFQVEELSEGTFAVTTDAGRALLHVRGQETAEGMADEQ